MFPAELERDAYRDGDEFGWTRAQVPLVIDILRRHGIGILGGDLWWVREGITGYFGAIPQRYGPPGVYTWVSDPRPDEEWTRFVERSAAEALVEVNRWPDPDDLPVNLPGRIVYNLNWVSEAEFAKLKSIPL